MKLQEKNLTIVLLDLIGSTAFVQKNGAAKAAKWLQFHDQLTRSLLYKFQGREIDRSDGFMLSFDRPIDAVNFALWYQKTIPRQTKLQCRIGIHYGYIVEVQQSDKYALYGAKSTELEGISKNIAARTMSICGAGQVLLTQAAFKIARPTINRYTPDNARFACVGLYRFKGVAAPVTLYAVAEDIEFLQPPPSSNKVKRIGGVRKIKSRARDRKLKEWLFWLMWRLFIVEAVWGLHRLHYIVSDPFRSLMNGLYDYHLIYTEIVQWLTL